jgi:Delta7-sterol 5-desaturase
MNLEFFSKWLHVMINISVRYFLIAGIAFFIFYILFRKKLFHKKIQLIFPSTKDYGRDIAYSLTTISVFAAVATLVLLIFPANTNMYYDPAKYGIIYYLFTFPLMFLIHDAYFYWIHRLMHHPKIFRQVHLVHHKSTNPTPWTSYAFHPLEALLEAGIIPLIAFTIPVHPSALVLFLLFQFIINVYGHLGFEIYPKNFHKTIIGKWINTSVAHNMHHKYFKGNYGLYFLFWDRWLGTLSEKYDLTYEKVTGKINTGPSEELLQKKVL